MKYNKNEVTGKMRDRIILQNVTRVRSLSGFASESWVDIATIWAFAESKLPGSNETIIDGKNTAKNVCDFTIRYISTITEESRVVWGDKLYQVKNLKVSHDRRFISFTGVFYDSYILTGVNVAASVNGIATTSANLKLIMSVIGQANAIASSFADLTVFQQGTVDVAASVNALGSVTANLTKVININGSVDANANVSAPLTIIKNIASNIDATATSTGNVQLIKLLSASVNANSTATSILDVVTQGIVLVDASVTATGITTANLTRIVTLESSSTTAAETSATAILTKVLEASATASAETNAAAQITIPVNASATTTAETSATAQLTYTVNASADATALTSAEAQIVRIISASATAMAESSAEASFGVTFVASVNGTATVTNATIARAATMSASVTGTANTTSALTLADNLVASATGQATVTNATLTNTPAVVFDTDAQAFFNRVTAAGGTLNSTEQNAVNTLVIALKANGVWADMLAIYPMVGSSAAACRQNLKSASFTGTFSSGWTFASSGVTPNGANAFMNTGFTPSTNFAANNSSFGVYSALDTVDNGTVMGAQSGASDSRLFMFLKFNTGGSGQFTHNSSSGPTFVLAASNGLITSNRITASQHKIFRNNTELTNFSSAEQVRANIPIYLAATNLDSVANYHSNRPLSFAFIGNGLTNTEVSNYYTAVQAFQTSLTRNI
jgi:SPP1 family predicted phage head-tail adaptor